METGGLLEMIERVIRENVPPEKYKPIMEEIKAAIKEKNLLNFNIFEGIEQSMEFALSRNESDKIISDFYSQLETEGIINSHRDVITDKEYIPFEDFEAFLTGGESRTFPGTPVSYVLVKSLDGEEIFYGEWTFEGDPDSPECMEDDARNILWAYMNYLLGHNEYCNIN